LDDRPSGGPGNLEAARRNRELPNVLAHLARLDVMAPHGASAETLTTIERARALAPGRDDYTLLHARVLAALGDFARARAVLGPLMVPGMPEHVRANARSWMGNVVRMENASKAAAERQAGAGLALAASPEPVPDAPAPPAVTRLILRRLLPGEQRLQGTLVAIDCPPGAPVAIRVTTPEGPRTLQARDLGGVEFITYRENASGTVNCGPLETPIPVYVTWRDGERPGSTEVVAVEFLPDR
jgi:hypothetical protein